MTMALILVCGLILVIPAATYQFSLSLEAGRRILNCASLLEKLLNEGLLARVMDHGIYTAGLAH
jgi:hypothetical protein